MAVLPSPHIFARISGVTWVFLTTPRSEPVTVYVCVCWLRFLTSRSLVTTLTTCEVSPPPAGMITETWDCGPVTTVRMGLSDVWFIFVFLPLLRILSLFGFTFAFRWTEWSSSRICQTSRLFTPTPALWRYFLCSGCILIYSRIKLDEAALPVLCLSRLFSVSHSVSPIHVPWDLLGNWGIETWICHFLNKTKYFRLRLYD